MLKTLLLFFITLPAAASIDVTPPFDCGWQLLPEEARELRISPEFHTFLQGEPRYRALMRGIAGVMEIISSEEEDLQLLAKLLSAGRDPDAAGQPPLRGSRFIAALGSAYSPAAREKYAILHRSVANGFDDRETLSALGYVTRNVPRVAAVEELTSNPFSPDDPLRPAIIQPRVKLLLGTPRFRAALLAMLAHEPALLAHKHLLAKGGPAYAASAPDGVIMDAERVRAKVRAGGHGADVQFFLRDFILAFAMEAKNVKVPGPITKAYFHRVRLLAMLTHYLKDTPELSALVADVIDIVDFYFFGTPFPLTAAALREEVLTQAKALLMPIKAEFSKELAQKAQAQKAQSLAPSPGSAPLTPREFTVVDLFAPGPAPHVRIKDEPAPAPRAAASPREFRPEDIPAELSLHEFTSEATRPRKIAELKAGVTYQFWFLRDRVKRLERVRFSEPALDAFAKDEDVAQDILDQLHQGHARDVGQNGLKLVKGKYPRAEGHVYEVKTSGTERGLLTKSGGLWHFSMMSEKKRLQRDAYLVTPVEEAAGEDGP